MGVHYILPERLSFVRRFKKRLCSSERLIPLGLSVQAPDRRSSIRLRDSRSLAMSEWGRVDGIPVLFCTGAGMSSCLGFGSEHVADLGVRLIAIDRPGLGLSDPHPIKTLVSWTDDIQQLISLLQVQQPSAVGFSQGAPFALALAAHGLVKSIAIVSGQDELAHPTFASQLHPDVARMIQAIENDPAEFEKQFASLVTADGLWQLIIGMSAERDRQLYLDEVFSRAFKRSLEEGFSQGARGYARDLVNAMVRWPFSVEEINVPVSLWYGRADTSTVHSPDFGSTLARRLPAGSLHVFENEGGSLLWTKSWEILEQLTEKGFR